MIKKGMEVGAVFEDGGSLYIVEKLCGDNYISRRLTKAEIAAEELKKEVKSVETTEIEDESPVEISNGNLNVPEKSEKVPETSKTDVKKVSQAKKTPVKRPATRK